MYHTTWDQVLFVLQVCVWCVWCVCVYVCVCVCVCVCVWVCVCVCDSVCVFLSTLCWLHPCQAAWPTVSKVLHTLKLIVPAAIRKLQDRRRFKMDSKYVHSAHCTPIPRSIYIHYKHERRFVFIRPWKSGKNSAFQFCQLTGGQEIFFFGKDNTHGDLNFVLCLSCLKIN